MKTRIALAGLFIALLPTMSLAAPAKAHPVKAAPKATKTAAVYECSKCHMKVGAAVAKKDHFKDPMDGGTLTPIRPRRSRPMGPAMARGGKAVPAPSVR